MPERQERELLHHHVATFDERRLLVVRAVADVEAEPVVAVVVGDLCQKDFFSVGDGWNGVTLGCL